MVFSSSSPPQSAVPSKSVRTWVSASDCGWRTSLSRRRIGRPRTGVRFLSEVGASSRVSRYSGFEYRSSLRARVSRRGARDSDRSRFAGRSSRRSLKSSRGPRSSRRDRRPFRSDSALAGRRRSSRCVSRSSRFVSRRFRSRGPIARASLRSSLSSRRSR